MFTEIHYPEKISPGELDAYLDRGWFRMGQMIFTCRFLCFSGELYSAIWTRLDLRNYRFRKSLKKLLKRNSNHFRVLVRKAVFDDEKEILYQRHKSRFEGYIAETLKESLHGEANYNIYDTWEICVYDENRLVAVSFFDIGGNSLASIMGLFDPAYSKYSLGFYTMLLEIMVGHQNKKAFYYPGYVVPGYAHFDYKARIGPVDYFDAITENWLPYNNIEPEDIPLEILKSEIKTLQTAFAKAGLESKPVFYPYYEEPIISEWSERFLSHPLFLIHKKEGTPFYHVSTYNLKSKKYMAYLCFVSSDLTINATAQPVRKFDNHFVPLRKILEIAMVFPPTEQLEKVLERAKLEIRVKGD